MLFSHHDCSRLPMAVECCQSASDGSSTPQVKVLMDIVVMAEDGSVKSTDVTTDSGSAYVIQESEC